MTDTVATIDRLITRAGQLCTLPAVAMKVLELTSDPQVDTRALKQCLENDPALTSKVLRVVNSSLFGLSREVSDLNQALALLGTKPLKLLVLGFSLPSGLFNGVEQHTLGWYWRHALTKAVAAREIAETAWSQSGDEAFVASLLQDLGLLLLIQQLGPPYIDFLEKVRAQGGDLLALEAAAMGFDHTAVTSRLLGSWGLPENLVEAVRWPVGLSDAASATLDARPAQRRLIQIVRMAELVARLVADDQPCAFDEVLSLGKREHDLTPEQLGAMLGRLEEKVERLADVLSLRLPEGMDYRDVLARSQKQLAEVAAEAAEELLQGARETSPTQTKMRGLGDESDRLSSAIEALSRRPAEVAAARVAQPAPEKAAAASFLPSRSPAQRSAASVDEADPGLLGRLAVSVSACRQGRCALSLLLVELVQADQLLATLGVDGLDDCRDLLESVCWRIDHAKAAILAHGQAGFAIVLSDCERQAASRLGNQLIADFRRHSVGLRLTGDFVPAVAIGAATVSLPPKNFPPDDLFVAADRCLRGSHASGGGVVKSIEIY